MVAQSDIRRSGALILGDSPELARAISVACEGLRRGDRTESVQAALALLSDARDRAIRLRLEDDARAAESIPALRTADHQ